MPRVVSALKNRFVQPGRRDRAIRVGPFRGLTMTLDLTSQAQLWLGLFEREITGRLGALARGVNTAIDVGAAEGEYSLFFLRHTTARRVIAFEPDAVCRSYFFENLVLNGRRDDPRLSLIAQFVGAGDRGQTCLDALLPVIQSPCLIKVDVDGGELDVLRGALKLANLPDTRWIIETHSAELERDCAALLTAAGYTVEIVPNAWWRVIIPELRPSTQNRWLIATRRPLAG